MVSAKVRGNYQKHQNPNPIQRWLISRFHAKVYRMVSSFCMRIPSGSHALTPTSTKIKPGKELTLLDVGCGEGFVLFYLREHLPGISLTGVDNEEEAISIARETLPDLNLSCADACRLPFADDSFDVSICFEVLEHLDEPEKALSELIRVSRRFVFLSVPNQPLFALANFLRGKNLSRFGEDPEHVQHWTGKGFLSFLKGRIDIINVDYSFPWIIVAAETPGHKKAKGID